MWMNHPTIVSVSGRPKYRTKTPSQYGVSKAMMQWGNARKKRPDKQLAAETSTGESYE